MLIVLPPVLLAFTNPTLYMPLIMKSVLLGQQVSVVSARTAGRELIGAIFLAGLFAILFWFALKILPSLWMFFLLMLLFGMYFAAKLYWIIASRFPAFFLAGRGHQPADPARSGRRGQRQRQGPLQSIRRPLHPVRRRHAVCLGRDRRAGVAARTRPEGHAGSAAAAG